MLGLQVLHTLLSHTDINVSVEDGDRRQPLLWAASAGSAKAVLALVKTQKSLTPPALCVLPCCRFELELLWRLQIRMDWQRCIVPPQEAIRIVLIRCWRSVERVLMSLIATVVRRCIMLLPWAMRMQRLCCLRMGPMPIGKTGTHWNSFH